MRIGRKKMKIGFETKFNTYFETNNLLKSDLFWNGTICLIFKAQCKIWHKFRLPYIRLGKNIHSKKNGITFHDILSMVTNSTIIQSNL